MSQIYVPWSNRPSTRNSALSRMIAGFARAVAALVTPILTRFQLTIFALAVIGACLAAWGVAVLCRTAAAIESAQAGWLSLGEVRAALDAVGYSTPAWLVWPLQLLVVRDLIGLIGIITFVSVLAMFAIWWERKVSARIQSRLGPMRVGGWHGWSQSLADGLKLLCKEDLAPADADVALFRLAPYLSFVPAIVAFVALPFGAYWALRDIDTAIVLVGACLGLDILGVLLAGWASNNKWSVYGAMREACQVVSYEIPMGMALLVPIMVVGSLRLGDFATHQSGGWQNWLAWHSPWTFIAMFVYFTASLAACKRAPFDLPEAESELVAGFHTEYSGFRWSLFFFAEYAAMFVVSGLLVILFLGAADSPIAGLMPEGWSDDTSLGTQLLIGTLFSGPIWFVAKCMFLVYVQMWLRWTLPRLRIDQVLYACVQVLLPLIMLVLLLAAFWEYAVGAGGVMAGIAAGIRIVLAAIGAIGFAAIMLIALAGFSGRTKLVGTMAVRRPLYGG
ncbi:MAG: complex I subunit 1 family protein [Phycisphaerae bacterium]